ncbi:MAG TPA: rhodanese-like domain-containing protein, partial [Verrucomicrobiae bacterium]|nr:rhodanese-like domain-containing protein [Verrucomicrobiae bacterium]
LFVNDVGRPDLRDADSDSRQLAERLYDSLFDKIFSLPDDVKVYPAHGAGSLCGRALGSDPFTTVGQQRRFNWAAQIKDRGEFVKQMLTNLPDRPAYFNFDVSVNLRGAAPFSELAPLRALSEAEVNEAVASGAVVIDTRGAPFFGAGHFPDSMNIGLASAMFSTWVGFFVSGDCQIMLAVNDPASAGKARLALARIGFDDVLGYIEADTLTQTRQLSQLSAADLKSSLLRGDAPFVLDVRTAGEWQNGHIDPAKHLPLPALPKRISEVPRGRPLAIICGSGYRSSIAASLLLRAGYSSLANVMGGMGAYQESQCPDWQAADLVFAGEYI